MSSAEPFPACTADTAPAAAIPLVVASEKQFGFLPSPVAKGAASPAFLKHMLAGFAAFERSSLSEIEREVVAMTVAFENECGYCMALHSALLSRTPEHSELVAALRTGTPLPQPRLEVLREFTRAIVRRRGHVSEECRDALDAAGFSREQALDVMLGVGVYMLSTLGNTLMGVELDAPLIPFAWQKPAADMRH
jgi:uncharacterized peroxidase-related enzyme